MDLRSKDFAADQLEARYYEELEILLNHPTKKGEDTRALYASLLLSCAHTGNSIVAMKLLTVLPEIANTSDKDTGLTPLHIAVGRDHIDMARCLVERGAKFVPDKQGRLPSTIAVECEVSDEMCDFIVEAEAKAEGV